MSILTSSPGAHRALRPTDWTVAYLTAWLAPVAVGIGMIVLHLAVSQATAGTGMPLVRMTSYFVATALVISPAFTWIGLCISAPLIIALQALGWFGWLPALAVGALTGAAAATLMGGVGSVVGPAFGLFGGALLWLALRYRRRDLFA